MKVAILYSGGKDSNYAIDLAKEKGWEIEYLLSVKPSRTDCFLFHFATVENTVEQAKILGLKHILVGCDVADPIKEAEIVRKVVEENKVDAVILGGTGLQETQINSIKSALRPLGVEAFAAHDGLDQDKIMLEMVSKGYEFMITQVASDGMINWLGKKVNKGNIQELFKDGEKYGFHISGDGGYWDSFVLDSPLFSKKIEVVSSDKVVKDEYCGYMVFNDLKIVEKELGSIHARGV